MSFYKTTGSRPCGATDHNFYSFGQCAVSRALDVKCLGGQHYLIANREAAVPRVVALVHANVDAET